MTTSIHWQHDCPGFIETEIIDGIIKVTCYVEDSPEPPPQRVTDGLQVLYTFLEGDGKIVHDVSGVGLALDLAVESLPSVTWLSGGGLSVKSPTVIVSLDPATKLSEAVKASNAVTVEAWLKPANLSQRGPSRIITVSADYHQRNFNLAQAAELYDFRLRTTETTENGRPSLSTQYGALETKLTHVVYTRGTAGHAKIYLDGEVAAEKEVHGEMTNWDKGYHLALANEMLGSREWLGEFHLVAAYHRALSAEEIAQNLEAGPQRA